MSIKNIIWYEKHRPKSLKQMALPEKHLKAFASYVKEGDFPHLLFYGPPGSGKTTTAQILMFTTNCRRLELNASSDDRGIATMKGEVKRFASSKSMTDKVKVVFLDEADGLTRDAQEALRNTMERYASTTKFILTANNKDRISDPIKSRCSVFEFASYGQKELKKYLIGIVKKEKIEYDSKDLTKLIKRFYPDARTIINNLQIACISGKFKLSDVLSATTDPFKLGELLVNGQLRQMRKQWAGTIDFVWFYKYLFDRFVPEIESDELKADCAQTVAEHLYRDAVVADREINMAACCVELMVNLEVDIVF